MADTDDTFNDDSAIDDEMKELLQKLDDVDTAVKLAAEIPPLKAEVPSDPSPEPTVTSVSEIVQELDYRHVEAETMLPAEVIVPPPPPLFDTKAEFDHFNAISDEMIQCARADRQETQDAITLVRTQIDKTIQSTTGVAKIERGLLDNLSLLLEVKKDISMTFAKALESRVKLIAALKPNQINIQNNVGAGATPGGMVDQDLVKTLSIPVDVEGDDEY
jgi:hypothetical protein